MQCLVRGMTWVLAYVDKRGIVMSGASQVPKQLLNVERNKRGVFAVSEAEGHPADPACPMSARHTVITWYT